MMEALLKDATIVNKAGEKVSLGSFTGAGKIVGIYFSAHWCPPCRGFTPTLAEYYNKVKDSAKGADFEIIFVSCDRDDDSFKSYYKSMPWLALDFNDKDANAALSQKFEVRGIPAFIVLDGNTGDVKDRNGRGTVEANKESGAFPW